MTMMGQTISHYRVIRKLGEGGMGEVYLAEDLELYRQVAMKFLSVQYASDVNFKDHLKREAQTAASLNHPNIVTIHEVSEHEGKPYIVMEYVEGISLRKLIGQRALSIDEITDIAIQICSGLAKAHAAGIIHRDIKSHNLLIDKDDRLRILDFGLAKVAHDTMTTGNGTVIGTVSYMSPEQVRGEKVDHRTDIWSMGVVLHELLTGRMPFSGDNDHAMIYSILNTDPIPVTAVRPDAPPMFEQIVKRALAKNPDHRYRQATDVLEDLRDLKDETRPLVMGTVSATAEPSASIAVLPLKNLTGSDEQEYFCDGLAEEIINALTHVDGLYVVARTSAFSFRSMEMDIREIGRRLSVGTVLEGSVRKAGSRLRISVQLIDVANGYHIWSEKYDRDIGDLCCPEDIFSIQDEISLAVVDNLRVELLGPEKSRILKRHTEDIDAYNLYLKGRYFWSKRTEESLEKAIHHFEVAVARDPGYALAYVGLANSWITLQDYCFVSPKIVLPKAREYVSRALELDGDLAEAHASLAQILHREWDLEAAEREYKRAIELSPDCANAHHWYALSLAYMDRPDEAVAEIKSALRVDPLSLVMNRNFGLILCHAHRYDEAEEQLRRTWEMEPTFNLVHGNLGLVYARRGEFDKAMVEFEKEREILKGWNHELESWQAVAYAEMGKTEDARKILAQLEEQAEKGYVPTIMVASVCFALREDDKGFEWLDRGYCERDSTLIEINVDPAFDRVQSHPRFIELKRKVGLIPGP
jgi:serine/threonine-protein kinase